jgi:hypothetical protein
MATHNRWFAPVRQMAAAFFQHDVKLTRREDGQVKVVLAERERPDRAEGRAAAAAGAKAPAGGKPQRREDGEKRRRQEELTVVRTELAALLNELPDTRSTMKHLVFIEQAITKKGLRVLHKLPLPVLRRAHEQLENLVTNWSPTGLANLRSKMAVAIIDREHMEPQAAEADAYRTAAVMDSQRVEITEHPFEGSFEDSLAGPLRDLMEPATPQPEDELALAYASLGDLAPTQVELQGELGSASARELVKPANRILSHEPTEISIRTLQP